MHNVRRVKTSQAPDIDWPEKPEGGSAITS
ncbi:tail fiber assembly protein [Enterobacter cancerogenus]|nr:hypothetical protein [Enterobacter cancerogenus]QZY39085.1 tail fiber assembly protein [Enterobacter cancerogenus]HDR2624727.1 tail fiber assembly protein [Enterobacter cancerogenus]